MSKIPVCENCMSTVNLHDSVCPSCNYELEGLSDAALEITNVKADDKEVFLTINGKDYKYPISTIKSGKFEGKDVKGADLANHLKSMMEKAGAGKMLGWVKSNFGNGEKC